MLALLEKVKGIAKNGLYYSNNDYDRQRYAELIEVCSQKYAEILDIDTEIIKKSFLKESGMVSPITGVNAAIFENNQLLIAKRKDDSHWELPGGWMELGETPRETLQREIQEELSIEIKPNKIIEIITRKPGDFSQTFTSMHILIYSEIISGVFIESNETSEIMWITINEIDKISWHRDHRNFAEVAFRYKSIEKLSH